MSYCHLAKTPALPLFSRVSPVPKFSNISDGFCLRAPEGSSGSKFLSGYCWESLGGGSREVNENFAEESSSLWKAGGFPCVTSGFAPKPRSFSSSCMRRKSSNGSYSRYVDRMSGLRTRFFFSTVSGKVSLDDGTSAKAGKALPWIAAYGGRGRNRGEDRASLRTKRSSWEQSADKFFAKDSGSLVKEKWDRTERNTEELEHRNFHVADRVEREEDEEDADPVDNPKWYKIKDRYKQFGDRESRFEKPQVRQWSKQENWGKKTWKEGTESSVPRMVGQGVYGVGPVLAALTAGRREFYALYVQEGLDFSLNNKKKKDKKGVEKVLKMAEKIGLKVVEASKHDLNMVVDNRPHQGLVLDASPLEMINIRELEPIALGTQKAPIWVALDEVTDPQNLGAIVRSAYFFGADGVVLCAKNSAPLSGVVSKASAGSLELIELRSCKNMMQFLSSSTENGWRVLGGSVAPKAIPLTEVEPGEPTILVLGSEGSGLRPLVERSCTQLIRIPGSIDGYAGGIGADIDEGDQSQLGQDLKSFLAVESLNVSVAAGVLLFHLVKGNSHVISEKPNSSLA
ncbi:uncharacterized protein [Typha angustifolia]|uniref:uncharacterized protein n=1 Tax=Typha angustifolia TaxID=59011 RepID=UPI003C2D73EF